MKLQSIYLWVNNMSISILLWWCYYGIGIAKENSIYLRIGINIEQGRRIDELVMSPFHFRSPLFVFNNKNIYGFDNNLHLCSTEGTEEESNVDSLLIAWKGRRRRKGGQAILLSIAKQCHNSGICNGMK